MSSFESQSCESDMHMFPPIRYVCVGILWRKKYTFVLSVVVVVVDDDVLLNFDKIITCSFES